MAHVDQKKLMKILIESDGQGHLECMPWEPQHWINADGHSSPKALFEIIDNGPNLLYIYCLVLDTIDEVDRIIENMIKGDKE